LAATALVSSSSSSYSISIQGPRLGLAFMSFLTGYFLDLLSLSEEESSSSSSSADESSSSFSSKYLWRVVLPIPFRYFVQSTQQQYKTIILLNRIALVNVFDKRSSYARTPRSFADSERSYGRDCRLHSQRTRYTFPSSQRPTVL
jgi:hypothetical protein